jgi:hypothetical protein
LEWAVLNWNRPAIEFYRLLGAVLPDWQICRMTGEALERLRAVEEKGVRTLFQLFQHGPP